MTEKPSVTGRDGLIVAKALAYATAFMDSLPEEKLERSNRDDMVPLLHAAVSDPVQRERLARRRGAHGRAAGPDRLEGERPARMEAWEARRLIRRAPGRGLAWLTAAEARAGRPMLSCPGQISEMARRGRRLKPAGSRRRRPAPGCT